MNARWEFRILLVLGIAVAALAVHLIRKGEPRRAVSFALAWVLPGAGHVLMGKWMKGLFLFTLLGLTYLFGLVLVDFRAVSFEDNPFYFVGRYGSGATLYLSNALSAEKSFPRPDMHPSWYDPGLLYICVVGLLNLVVMMNVLEIRAQAAPAAASVKPESAPAPAPSEAPPAEASPDPSPSPPTEKPA